MNDLFINECEQGVEIRVKVVPASSKTMIAGTLDNMLKVKIAAPPEDGKANKSLIDFMAKLLNLKKKDIKIVSGKTSPIKVLRISGMNSLELITAFISLVP